MATDDQRREAAERLRKARWYTIVGKRGDGLTLEWNVALMSDLADAVGLRDAVGIEVFDRLADLVEPSCDRDALLALAVGLETDADRIIKAAKDARFGGGPRMGEAKHYACEWRSIARFIREACGVVA